MRSSSFILFVVLLAVVNTRAGQNPGEYPAPSRDTSLASGAAAYRIVGLATTLAGAGVIGYGVSHAAGNFCVMGSCEGSMGLGILMAAGGTFLVAMGIAMLFTEPAGAGSGKGDPSSASMIRLHPVLLSVDRHNERARKAAVAQAFPVPTLLPVGNGAAVRWAPGLALSATF